MARADALEETMLALGFYAEAARDVAALPVAHGEKTPGDVSLERYGHSP